MANERWKKWYEKNREKFNALANKHKRSQRRKMKDMVDERKKQPCIICSKSFPPEAMDLYHRDGEEKKFRISDAGRKIYSLGKLEEELEKCDVYCACCRLIVDRESFLDEKPSGSSGVRRKKLRDLVNKAKGVKCSDCGEVYPFFCMELDHLEDKLKEGTISHMVSSGISEEKILEEVAKTESVCTCCHRIRTSKRNQHGKKENQSENIDKWLKDNIDKVSLEKNYSNKNTNPCFFYSAVLAILFPKLKLMKGKQEPAMKGDTAHFWVEDKGGKVTDPTGYRYPNVKIKDGKEVSAKRNIKSIVSDKLFKSLSKEDKKIILDLQSKK